MYSKYLKLKIALTFSAMLFFLVFTSHLPSNSSLFSNKEANVWEQQLNELNAISMRIASINILYGLQLNAIQIKRLQFLQKDMETFYIDTDTISPQLLPEVKKIKILYTELYDKLLKQEHLSDSLIETVFKTRLTHSLLIKKTLLGKPKIKESKLQCTQCHALPRHFPKEDINTLKTKTINPFVRKKIDKAHLVGLFSQEGYIKLWYLRNDVYDILNDLQKNIIDSYSPCLIPPGDFNNPMRAGQAFSNEKWYAYLEDIRKHDKKHWKKYKNAYLQPLDDLIEATLPGITSKNKKGVLKNIENILNKTRDMDAVTYDLQKDKICNDLELCFNVNNFSGAPKRSLDIKKYMAAMYLLYPGMSEVYEKMQIETKP